MSDENNNKADERDYVVDPEKGLDLGDDYFSRYNYVEGNDKVKIISPALFFGIVILIIATGFGIFMMNSFGN